MSSAVFHFIIEFSLSLLDSLLTVLDISPSERWPCGLNHFKCGNGFCVPEDDVCNFVDDCGDASDEKNCEHRECYAGEFRCQNGECVRPTTLCDGGQDCNDGSDESHCNENPDPVAPTESHPHNQSYGQERCPYRRTSPLTCERSSPWSTRAITWVLSPFIQAPRKKLRSRQVHIHLKDALEKVLGQVRQVQSVARVRLRGDALCLCVPHPAPRSQASRTERTYSSAKPTSELQNMSLCRCLPAVDFVTCASGRRVHRYFWCDGWPDCDDNHADEAVCGECTDGAVRCSTGRCVQLRQQCDGYCDCVDCEDEIQCHSYYTKENGVLTCRRGAAVLCVSSPLHRQHDRCIRSDLLCDGVSDCQRGSDERHCNTSDFLAPLPSASAAPDGTPTPPPQCPKSGLFLLSAPKITNVLLKATDFYFCYGEQRRFPSSKRCDFFEDCLFGDDEENCPSVNCSTSEWQCENGECIASHRRCDNVFHCKDKSDEISCQSHQCANSSHVPCASGQCVPATYWCDHHHDCLDGSDEAQCDFPRTCSEGEFQCASKMQCIPENLRCVIPNDTRSVCADNSHLVDCRGKDCGPDQHKCVSGPCLDARRKCNGIADCIDSWDDEDKCRKFFTIIHNNTALVVMKSYFSGYV
ncbi:Low-density lipoprotein (LDL) receptor class A repeat [Trinorchestia longiramus]|nr:Low-density lipoprotein (LDL) receptor class A repeat [Trinorchestia longiramus]